MGAMARYRIVFVAALRGSSALAGCDQLEDVFVKRSPGEKLYRSLCADCHGLDARGNTPQYMGNPNADLTGALERGSDPGSIEIVIREGVFGKMPAHNELTYEQMKQLLDWIQELRKRAQGPV